jgi:hypothetical protein
MDQDTIYSLISDYFIESCKNLCVRNTMDEGFEIVGVYIDDDDVTLIID